jgi:hypothetical protein
LNYFEDGVYIFKEEEKDARHKQFAFLSEFVFLVVNLYAGDSMEQQP